MLAKLGFLENCVENTAPMLFVQTFMEERKYFRFFL